VCDEMGGIITANLINTGKSALHTIFKREEGPEQSKRKFQTRKKERG